jgi:actin-related protein
MKYPISEGNVTNWDDLEKILHHAFYNELRVCPEEQPLLLLLSPSLTSSAREKLAQIVFEVFCVPSLYLLDRSSAALFSYGVSCGLAVHIGSSHSTLLPLLSLSPHFSSFMRLTTTGDALTQRLMTLLSERGYSFTTTAERDIVRDIKEKLCYVSQDFQAEMAADGGHMERSYELPDGQVRYLSLSLSFSLFLSLSLSFHVIFFPFSLFPSSSHGSWWCR